MRQSNGKVWAVICNGEIEIRSLTRADLEDALNVLDRSFFVNESVCIACEINLPENTEARRELRELCRQTAEDGVSIVAKHAGTGNVVAVAFNKIQYLPRSEDEEPFFTKFRREQTHSPQAIALMDFMITVDEQMDVFELYKIDCSCELMFLATLPEFERKGIGRALASATIELTQQLSNGEGIEEIHPDLRDMRPKAVTAIFTSMFSQKVGKSQGFKVLNSVPYTKFQFNGKTFDKRINPMHKTTEHVALLV